MDSLALLGWLAAATGMISGLPQIIRIFTRRTSAGVSIRLWQLNLGAMLAWMAHGFLVGHPQLQIPNAFLSTCGFLVLLMVARDRKRALLPLLVLPAVLASGLFIIDYTLGALVFGLVVAAPGVAGMAAQLRTMMRSADLSGVSPGYLGVTLAVQVLWLAWGIPTVEWALIVCASLLGIATLVNLAYWGWRQLARQESDDMVTLAG